MTIRRLSLLLAVATSAAASEPQVIAIGRADDADKHLTQAMAAVNAGQAQVISFGPGEFQLSQPLVFHLRFGHPGLRIHGAGPGRTRLVFTDADAAIQATLDTRIPPAKTSPSISIDNLPLVASGKCGAAIDLRPGAPDHRGGVAQKSLHHLAVEGRNGSWTTGIRAEDLAFCSFRDLKAQPAGRRVRHTCPMVSHKCISNWFF